MSMYYNRLSKTCNYNVLFGCSARENHS